MHQSDVGNRKMLIRSVESYLLLHHQSSCLVILKSLVFDMTDEITGEFLHLFQFPTINFKKQSLGKESLHQLCNKYKI